MKFSIAAVFAAGALATPTLTVRQVGDVTASIATISQAVSNLDSAINSFSGPNDVQNLISVSGNVVSAIQAGTTTANGIQPLSTPDAFSLIDPISNLIGIVQQTVKDLEAKKPIFQSNNLCGQVLAQVTAQQNAAQDFQNALIAKVPTDIQPTAQGLAAQITAALADAASSFKSCAATTTTTTSSSSSSVVTTITTITTTSGTAVITTTCTTTTTPPPPPPYYQSSSSPVAPPAYPSSSPVAPPAYPSSSPVAPPAYPSSSPVAPPAYPSSSPVAPPAYPSSSKPAGSVPPVYPSSSPVAPPAYPSSSKPAGSVPPTYPSSVPVVPPTYPSGTTPVAPGKTTTKAPTTSPTLISSNSGAKQVAGMGGVALAAIIAIAAF